MSFAQLRESIRATRDSIYMNTGFNGPSPDNVLERIQEVLEEEARLGPASPAGLQYTRSLSGEAMEQVAGLLNCTPEEIILTHGTTEGCHVVIYGMNWGPGDELVSCNLEHPALGTPASVLEERYGATARRVEIDPKASAGEIVEAFAGAINEKTKLVALSHVQFSCGLKLPIKAITDAAHRQGVPVLVDGAQTGGQLDIDVKAMGVDYYSISGQKWMCGPQGTGALYVNGESWRDLNPLFTTHAIVEARSQGGDAPGPVRPGMRFRIASQSAGLTAGFTTAVANMRALGLDNIEARCAELAGRMKDGIRKVPGLTLTCPDSDETSAGLVSVAVDGWQPSQVVDALWTRWKIAVRAVNLPPAIRISNGPFNIESEVDTLVDALRTLTKEEAPPLVEGAH